MTYYPTFSELIAIRNTLELYHDTKLFPDQKFRIECAVRKTVPEMFQDINRHWNKLVTLDEQAAENVKEARIQQERSDAAFNARMDASMRDFRETLRRRTDASLKKLNEDLAKINAEHKKKMEEHERNARTVKIARGVGLGLMVLGAIRMGVASRRR